MKRTPLKRKIPLQNPAKKLAHSRGLRIRIDPLDTLVSEYVRKRAVQRTGGCERCFAKHTWKELQCSHYFGRADKSTRYEEDNLAGLCFACHNYFHAHPLEHTQWFQRNLGERFAMLEGRNRIMGKPDKKALTLYFKLKLREIDE